jgi:hypothetical protein
LASSSKELVNGESGELGVFEAFGIRGKL